MMRMQIENKKKMIYDNNMVNIFKKVKEIISIERLKIVCALFISFWISSFIFNYSTLPERSSLTTEKVVSEILLFKDRISSLFTIQGINFNLNNFPTTVPRPTNLQKNDNNGSIIFPTEKRLPTIVISKNKVPSPTEYINNNQNNITPTKKPTTKPSPTVKKTPTPTIISKAVRPGTSWDEITKTTSQKTCVPQAMIKAISVVEAGTVSNFSTKQMTLYNGFNWWNEKKTTEKEICDGYAYYACTNQIPADSNFGGEYCFGGPAYGLCSQDIKILGPMQTSDDEWNKSKSRVITALKGLKVQVDEKTVDRRVFLDGFLAGGFTIKDYSYTQTCSGWNASVVETVARRYYGKCEYNIQGRTGNYCYDVCLKYNYYGGSADCSQIK